MKPEKSLFFFFFLFAGYGEVGLLVSEALFDSLLFFSAGSSIPH
jgi:hypothetical protein